MNGAKLGLGLPALVAMLLGLAIAPAGANWVASGTFKYEDREQDQTGFTGNILQKPMRYTDIEVVDANKSGPKAILARGKTDVNGNFSTTVADSSTRTVYIRALSTSLQTSDLFVKVTTPGGSIYALRTSNLANHNPNTNVNYGVLLGAVGNGGEAFHIFDMLVYGADFIKVLTGSRPNSSKLITVKWAVNAGVTGASFVTPCCTMTLRDYAAYDKRVILHEWSHYVGFNYWKSSNPDGTHGLAECNQDIRLAFDEGRASWFGNSVLRYYGFLASNWYLRTTGAPGPGGVQNEFNLEEETEYPCDGDTAEVAVARSLWDIADSASTTDNTPGVDDDPPDALAQADLEAWQVMVGPAKTATWVTHESFWDGWFDPTVLNGNLSQMRNIFNFLSMEFQPDVYEPNNTTAAATPIASNGPPVHLTYFHDPEGDGKGVSDTDIFLLDASPGVVYTTSTSNLLSDANTNLEILDTNGTTVLASNNDCAGTTDGSSCITWTAPSTGNFYIRSTHASDYGIHGSYDLTVTNP